MSDELCLLPATELRARVVRKDVSPVEIMRAVLARAERMQPELNCFITLCGDEAMAGARNAEREVMAGAPLGVLHGIPFTVKDIVNTKGGCERPSEPSPTRTTFPTMMRSPWRACGQRARFSWARPRRRSS